MPAANPTPAASTGKATTRTRKTAVSTLTSAKIFDADPTTIRIIEGFNVRKVDAAHVEALANAYRNNKPVPPVLVAIAEDGALELVDGEHRTTAAIAAGRALIPVMVFEGTAQERVGVAISSSQGRSLSPDERAGGYLRLRNEGWTDREIAEFTGRSEGDVANHLLLAQCGAAVLAKVADGTIKATPIFKLAREIGAENVWAKLESVMSAKAAEDSAALVTPVVETPKRTKKPAGAPKRAKITEADLLTSFGKKEAMRLAELATYFAFVGTTTTPDNELHTYAIPADVGIEFSALVKRYLADQPPA